MTRANYPKAVGLARACHPLPTVAVTGIATLLAVAVAANESVAWFALLTLTVLVGQLSIGWSNDLLDAERDTLAGRQDKPAAVGMVGQTALRRAAVLSLIVTVTASLGWGLEGFWHLVLVGSGWTYNLWLKPTVLSPLCYIVGFGSLPLFVYGAAGVTPPWWAPAGGALLGTAAHFANVAPDVDADLATGVRGLPQRLGARRSVAVSLALLLACGVMLLMQLSASGLGLAAAALAVVAPPAAGAWALYDRLEMARIFPLVLAGALVDTLLLLLAA
jgi:4-hydroxybenzoate polyprenyltransferase